MIISDSSNVITVVTAQEQPESGDPGILPPSNVSTGYLRSSRRANTRFRFPELRKCQGPRVEAETNTNNYHHMFGYQWAVEILAGSGQVIWYQRRGGDDTGLPEDFYPVELIQPFGDMPPISKQHYPAFDQAARPALAREHNGMLHVRQWNQPTESFIDRGPFPGVDPVLFNDATVKFTIPDSDLVLFHLSQDRLSLCYRLQRDNYAVMYNLHDFEEPMILDQVIRYPYAAELLLSNRSGAAWQDSVWVGWYPIGITRIVSGDGRFSQGDYIEVSSSHDATYKITGEVTLTEGEYKEIVEPHEVTYKITGEVELTEGEYNDIVLMHELARQINGDGRFTAGVYSDIALQTDLIRQINGDGRFIGGNYYVP